MRVAEARLPTDFGEFRIIGYRSLTRTKSSSRSPAASCAQTARPSSAFTRNA